MNTFELLIEKTIKLYESNTGWGDSSAKVCANHCDERTKGRTNMGKRFVIVIGVAALGAALIAAGASANCQDGKLRSML